MKSKKLIYLILPLLLLLGCKRSEKTSPIRKDIVDAVFASGSIITEDQYLVASQSEGYIKKYFVKEGDTVKVGQELFQIADDAPKAQLESALASYNNALYNNNENSALIQQLIGQKKQAQNVLVTDSLNYIRHKNLIGTNAVSQADYEKTKLAYENAKSDLDNITNNIINTKKNLELEVVKAKSNLTVQQSSTSYYSLKSDFSGIVLQKYKNNGEFVKIGETIAQIGSGEFIVKLDIAEDDIDKVKCGQDVFIELNTEKNKSYRAKVTKIYPSFSSQNQSFIVEAKFVELTSALKSGTMLQANIVIRKRQNALVIPSYYLLPNDYVILKGKDDKTKIDVGIRTIEWTEVLKGLDENSILRMPK